MSERKFTTLVAVIGRPNAGKSTLINALVGQKVAITSHRPQTTRHRIHAIDTYDNYQFVYIDTPGINQSGRTSFLKELNKAARSALADADIILFILDGLTWDRVEDAIMRYLPDRNVACIAVVNKVDRLRQQKNRLLEHMKSLMESQCFDEVVPMSGRKPRDVGYLRTILEKYAVEGPFIFPDDQCTDQNMRFYVSELVREKIMRRYNQEIPYSAAVTIDSYRTLPNATRIQATIHVEQDSHRRIIVGKSGSGIREIGKQVRAALEKQVGQHVDLRLWVKVSHAWSGNPALLRSFGYQHDS